jgi:hypothetical protein
MANLVAYRFVDFPYLASDGHTYSVSGRIVAVASSVPGASYRRWRAAVAVLDGLPPLCPMCRAKVEAWLHEMRRHDSAIKLALAGARHAR